MPLATTGVLLRLVLLGIGTSAGQLINQQNAFPPTSQLTNFYPGPVIPGAEPDLIRCPRQPMLDNHFPVLQPTVHHKDRDFKPSKSWGNLSPMFSLPPGTFGVASGAEIPPGCTLDQVHLLHRHGARYPTSDTRLAKFAETIHSAQLNKTLNAKGDLSFLNNWKYKLGAEVLTPFGRSQMFQLGVSYRQKYGFLLAPASDAAAGQPTNTNLPVFRTTSQHRMYHSALNFAAGFFGVPFEDQYHQSVIIESKGFNNSLGPYYVCPNTNLKDISKAGERATKAWEEISLKSARERLNGLITGIEFSIKDINTMQAMCSYESVALGMSDFCSLFTDEEWQDYAYSNDLDFWYGNSFGSPIAAAMGAGYSEELLARLTKTFPRAGMTSINHTLSASPVTFPLDQSIYVDATHDTVITAVVVALNFTGLAQSGPLPTDRRLEPRSFKATHIAPFGAQLATQVLTCPAHHDRSASHKFVRFILNDAVVPLEGMKGCTPDHEHGLCGLESFVDGLKTRLEEIDYQKTCFGELSYSHSDSHSAE